MTTGAADAIVERVDRLVLALAPIAGPEHAVHLDELRARLHEPLRIALAGRVKAGKSTLLNALVGDRLAGTDAGECTLVPAWYREGHAYSVRARLVDGADVEVPFHRDEGPLAYELPVATEQVAAIEVRWPSSALARATLIDTPGLASASSEAVSARTLQLLVSEEGGSTGEADAVIYLMRHLHARDAAFLDTFRDRDLAGASPVNAVAVLSRADEIGAGRLDAMEAARRIAARYQSDPRVQELCGTVVAVAGLLAETGLTITEAETATLKQLAALGDDELGGLLLGADRFVAPGRCPIPPEARAHLFGRLGLHGIRLALARLQEEPATTAVGLARILVEASGLAKLRQVLDEQLLPRAQVLKARSVLVALRAVGRALAASDPLAAGRFEAEVEAVEAASHELDELRLAHLVRTGLARFEPGELAELERLVGAGSPADRVGLGGTATGDEVATAAALAAGRWRGRAEVPSVEPCWREAAATMARAYESLWVQAHAGLSG